MSTCIASSVSPARVLGALMMVLGAYVAITRVPRRGCWYRRPGLPVGMLLAIALATIVVFPTLFGSALVLRRRTDFHKRLVLLATMELVIAAVARLPVIKPLGPPAFFGVTDLFVVALVVYDLSTRGRIHPATLVGRAVLHRLATAAPRDRVLRSVASFATWLMG